MLILISRDLLRIIYDEADSDKATARSKRHAVFGDGNIDTCFEKFPMEHQCNHFCTWMKLDKLESLQSCNET